MTIVNNKMLVLARESRGKTQQELVAMVGINQGNYSKMEKGLLNVPPDLAYSIATALDYPLSFFFKKAVHTPVSNFYYRKRISMPKKELSILEAKLDILRLSIDELLDSVDIPEYNLPALEISEDFTALDVARTLREFLRLPKGPVSNLVRTLEAAGIIVFFLKNSIDKFDGITLVTDKGQPVIFINEAMPNDRKRFTLAHELIHLVAHIPYTPLAGDRDVEAEANEGAAEFLMPYLDCRHDLQGLRYSQLSVLKSYWGVSKAMVLYRAKAINAISSEKCSNMYIELSRNGERKRESGFVEIDEPSLLDLIIKTHENDLGYRLPEMLGILGLNAADYLSYFKRSRFSIEVKAKKVIELSSFTNITEDAAWKGVRGDGK